MKFIFRPGEMECGVSIYSLPSIKVESWYYNPDINLPLNTDEFTLLQAGLKYGDQYMENHNLSRELHVANAKMIKAVSEAIGILKKYRVNHDDIQKLILSKLQG